MEQREFTGKFHRNDPRVSGTDLCDFVLGGISVAFPHTPFDRSVAESVKRVVVTHLLLLGLTLSALYFLGRRILRLVGNLEEARREIRTLEGILPMCSHCKKIRREGAEDRAPAGRIPVDACITDRSEKG